MRCEERGERRPNRLCEIDAGEIVGSSAHDVHARADAAREGDKVNAAMPCQSGARFTATADEVEDPRRQFAFSHQFREGERVQRRFFARLDDDGVASDKCWGELARDKEEREVPGQDARNNADGLAQEQDRLVRAVARDHFAFDTAGPLRHVVDVVRRELDLHSREAENLALLAGDQLRQALLVVTHLLRDLAQVAGALDRGHPLPSRLRSPRRGHRRIDLRPARIRHVPDGFVCRRIQYFQQRCRGLAECAIDEVSIVSGHNMLL